MRSKNIHFDTIISGQNIIMQKLNLRFDLETHVNGNNLKVYFDDFSNRVKLWVPVQNNLSFSISQILEYIYEQYDKKLELPSLIESAYASENISIESIRNHLNKK